MSSDTENTPSGQKNRSASNETSSPRKRKQPDETKIQNEESTGAVNTVSAAAPPPPPLSDEDEINSILTKRLSSDDSDDVAEALESFLNLVGPDNIKHKDNRKTAVRRGALLVVVQAMNRNVNSVNIQKNGLTSLVNLSVCELDSISTKQDVFAVDGLKCCIRAMQTHLDDRFVQAKGCNLIQNLLCSPDIRKQVVDGGGLLAVKNAMKNLKKHDGLVQHNVCRALKALLRQDSSWANVVVDAGFVELVIAAMKSEVEDADLQMYGCQIFSALSKAHQDYRSVLLESKCIGLVGEALRVHKDDAKVKSAAQKALADISA